VTLLNQFGVDGALVSYLLVFFRVAGVISLMPALGENSIPTRVKLGIALCMSLVAYPAVPENAAQGINTSGAFFGALIIEVVIGAFLGLLLRIFLFCLQVTGSIAAQSTSLSQILGMAGVEPLPALGHMITMAGMALAMMLGLHVYAAQYMIASYNWLPTGQVPDLGLLTETAVSQIAYGFQLAFALSAPFYILSLLYNLTLGVINRAMPQLMVAFVGAPVITAGALVLLAVAIPLMLSTWSGVFFDFLITMRLS
jgi:flagellar biosynthetic protein FliR